MVRIIKANLSRSRTRAKFCKLICDSAPIPKLTKLKLVVLKSDFQRQKERYEHR